MPDFTYEAYASLLDAFVEHDVPCLTVRDYLTRNELPPRFVVLRHDVDRKPENSLDFARLEAERGIESTYYVRTVDEVFDPRVVKEISSLGHEVGYHYEDLDRADGDVGLAREYFRANLASVRELVDVDTVCMHGNPLTPHDNRDLWGATPDFDAYGLLGEAYLSMDFTDVHYYSDTGRTWKDGALKVKDHTVGPDGKTVQVSTTPELADLVLSGEHGRFCLLSHPDRWAKGYVERVTETAFDTAKNTAKYGLQLVK